MQIKSTVLIAASLTTVIAAPTVEPREEGGTVTGGGLKWYEPNLKTGSKGVKPPSTYKCYTGPASAFPAKSEWMAFESAWSLQEDFMKSSQSGNKPEEYDYMRDAILKVSKESKVDARVILAMIMQESTGKVRIPCTKSHQGIRNCGLLQAYQSSEFNPSKAEESITNMIEEGIRGTEAGPGLAQDLNDSKAAGSVYNALRIYNSGIGSFDPSDLSKGNGATNSYVADIANRLRGWDGSGGEDTKQNCQ